MKIIKKGLIFLFILLMSISIYITVSYSHPYYLVYQVNLTINSFITENYNATIILYLKNYSSTEIIFSVVGIGNLYSFAQKTNFNISKVILMEAYNGTYIKPIGLGEGFPMLNSTELKSLRSEKFFGNNNGTYYNVSKEVIDIKGMKYQTYKIYGNRIEVGESGSICIFVNQSNGMVIKLVENASSFLGSIFITVTLVKASLPSYLLQSNIVSTTTVMAFTETSSIKTTSSSPSHESNNLSSNILVFITFVVIAIVIILVILLKKSEFK
ncbi:hypothetical protein EWF20_02870 [Sulfolobus sp. S-194]|uniref:hypothetical protein n=1 Tax=Sulfolobus sp. S-194 TaxID=2512240 RepID=UPI001436EB0F|nr:hypothetical protein [Sulfolobus sp. S-194]QIW23188.1 hypothetical protein EWF20_02870 [Sulfolobus sp. S-194]